MRNLNYFLVDYLKKKWIPVIKCFLQICYLKIKISETIEFN